jgi:hypothetical protein
MPTVVQASRYNNLRARVNSVLGTSTTSAPQFGYGQGTTSNAVIGTAAVTSPVDADKIQAQDYEDLYVDIVRARYHQVGSSFSIDDFVIGDVIANPATADKIEEAYITGLENLATNLETDKFLVDSSQLAVTGLLDAGSNSITSTRSSAAGPWNGLISHIFTVEFPTSAARRHFFNSGGQVRFQGSVNYTGSQAKTVDWQTILNNMGQISFAANSTYSNSSVGTGYSVGNYGLTSAYRLCYSKSGGALYARNDYEVRARQVSQRVIQFKVSFVDGQPNDTAYGIDELVYGDFESSILLATPIGQVNINGTVYPTVTYQETLPAGALISPL